MQRDDAYLVDMLLACRDILRYVDGATCESFTKDDRTYKAVAYSLIVIGETSIRLSEDARAGFAVEWDKVRGLRNVLVHEYEYVDPVRVWNIARGEVTQLEQLLADAVGGLVDEPDN